MFVVGMSNDTSPKPCSMFGSSLHPLANPCSTFGPLYTRLPILARPLAPLYPFVSAFCPRSGALQHLHPILARSLAPLHPLVSTFCFRSSSATSSSNLRSARVPLRQISSQDSSEPCICLIFISSKLLTGFI